MDFLQNRKHETAVPDVVEPQEFVLGAAGWQSRELAGFGFSRIRNKMCLRTTANPHAAGIHAGNRSLIPELRVLSLASHDFIFPG
jgi:hypothetical protein